MGFPLLFINLPPAERQRCDVRVAAASAPWTLALPPTTTLAQKLKKARLARQLFTHPNEFRLLLHTVAVT